MTEIWLAKNDGSSSGEDVCVKGIGGDTHQSEDCEFNRSSTSMRGFLRGGIVGSSLMGGTSAGAISLCSSAGRATFLRAGKKTASILTFSGRVFALFRRLRALLIMLYLRGVQVMQFIVNVLQQKIEHPLLPYMCVPRFASP